MTSSTEQIAIEETDDARQSDATLCTACGERRNSSLFCASCQAVTIPTAPDLNLFAVLGLPTQYDVDPNEVNRRYLNMSRDLHPDRLAGSKFATDAVRATAILNEAKRTLLDPFARAEYLLIQFGGKRADENKTVPPELLAETLELREEIDDARRNDDSEALARIRNTAEKALAENQQEVAELARQLPGDETLRDNLRIALNAHRYHQRLIDYAAGKQGL